MRSIYIYIYLLILLGTIIYYLITQSTLVLNLVAILSGLAIASALFQYVQSDRTRSMDEERKKNMDYIEYVSGIFIKIDNLFLEHQNDLRNLYYEFYGYSNFPYNNVDSPGAPSSHNSSQDVTQIEYIVINIIISYLNNLYQINKKFYQDINITNKIRNYTRSEKFKKVWQYVKYFYDKNFVKTMEEKNIINVGEIPTVEIPYLRSSK